MTITKLRKMELGEGNLPVYNSRIIIADNYNVLVDKINDVIDGFVEFNPQIGTAYTLQLSDVNKYIQLNNGNAITLTVPPFVDVAIPVGAMITLEQTGAGAFTVTAGTGVTLHGNVLSAGQYNIIVLTKTSINTWTCVGGTV